MIYFNHILINKLWNLTTMCFGAENLPWKLKLVLSALHPFDKNRPWVYSTNLCLDPITYIRVRVRVRSSDSDSDSLMNNASCIATRPVHYLLWMQDWSNEAIILHSQIYVWHLVWQNFLSAYVCMYDLKSTCYMAPWCCNMALWTNSELAKLHLTTAVSSPKIVRFQKSFHSRIPWSFLYSMTTHVCV